jgi:hypothetical protein
MDFTLVAVVVVARSTRPIAIEAHISRCPAGC